MVMVSGHIDIFEVNSNKPLMRMTALKQNYECVLHCLLHVYVCVCPVDAYWPPHWVSTGWCCRGNDAPLLPFWKQRHIG